MKKLLSIILLALFLGTGLPMINNSYGGDADQGKSLYDSKCVLCHGADGKGDGPAAPAMNPPPRNFREPQFWQTRSDKDIAYTIRNGLAAMPAFDLPEPEIKAIVDYMKHTFNK